MDSIVIKNSYQEIVSALTDSKGLVNVIDIDLREIDLFVAKVELLEKEIVNLDEFSLKLGLYCHRILITSFTIIFWFLIC